MVADLPSHDEESSMPCPPRPRFAALAFLSALCAAPGLAPLASAGTVTVVTSFPKELTQAYKTAFEKAQPGIKLEILNKNTVQGIAYVRELPAGQRPDIFWASAPDAFEVLAGLKLLDNVSAIWPTGARRPRSGPTRSTAPRACTWARRWPATA
jgi:hypothetical protein